MKEHKKNYLLPLFLIFFKISFIFREGKQGRKRGRETSKNERNIDHLPASLTPSTMDLACSPDMCPDQESNWHTFGLQDDV